MKRLLVTSLLCCIALPVAAQQTYFVSITYGDDAKCNGTVDQGVPGGCTSNCACAKRTINAAIALPLVMGDVVKVDAGDYAEAVDINKAGVTVEAKNPTAFPVILGTQRYLFDHSGWVQDSGDVWRTAAADYTSNVRAAYIVDGPSDYENGRVGLIPYHTKGHLISAISNYDSSGYYAGPGIIWDPSDDRLYIRLSSTTQLDRYQSEVLQVFTNGLSPNSYRIAVTLNSPYTVQISAPNVTIRNLQVEPSEVPVKISASNATVDGVTVWAASFGYGIANLSANASNVTIQKSRIYHDIGHWIAYTDCKTGPEVCSRMKSTGIRMFNVASNWTIYANHLRGLHDGIGTNSFNIAMESFNSITAKYNRIENIQDDAFEIEVNTIGESMGIVEIYGNFIGNALTCASIGQQSPGTWTGPVHFLSNVCSLMRPHHVNRNFANGGNNFNAGNGLRYGHEYALKWGTMDQSPPGPTDLNTNVYNNTFVLHDSRDSRGLHITNHNNNQGGDYFFNNLLIAVNGRVGTGSYFSGPTGPATIDDNLYYTFNNPGNLNLLDGVAIAKDDEPSTTDCCSSATCGNWECSGLGSTPFRGTDPQIDVLGFGCISGGQCTAWASDPNVIDGGLNPAAHLQTYPSSWVWDPSMFIPPSGSLVCGAGRGSVPQGLPERPVGDPSFWIVPFTSSVIGAIPCGTPRQAFNFFPVNQAWKTPNLITNDPPIVPVISPSQGSITICQGTAVNFCGTYEDPDGAPPFDFLWDFNNPATCPADKTTLCPGNVEFTTAGTCQVTFTVKDRWGEVSNAVPRTIIVNVCGGPPGGGCSNCNGCICQE